MESKADKAVVEVRPTARQFHLGHDGAAQCGCGLATTMQWLA